jgi:hypothetical protein
MFFSLDLRVCDPRNTPLYIGTGKSFLLKTVIRYLRQKYPSKFVAVTASTGNDRYESPPDPQDVPQLKSRVRLYMPGRVWEFPAFNEISRSFGVEKKSLNKKKRFF